MARDVSFLLKLPIAHRGFHDKDAPENTLKAFKQAIEHNYAIELDVQLSRDGQVVVFHDSTLRRVCNHAGIVREFTVEELQSFPTLGTNEPIPTFYDMLQLVQGKVPLIVELKSDPITNKQLPPLVHKLLKDYKGLFVVQSFNPFLVAWFAENAPEFLRGQLVMDYSTTSLPWRQKLILSHMITNRFSKPDYLNTQINYVTPKMRQWKRRGKTIISYTATNEIEYENAFSFFDNIIFEGFVPNHKF